MDRWEREREVREQLELKQVAFLSEIRFDLKNKHDLILDEHGHKINEENISLDFVFEQTGASSYYRTYNGKIRVYVGRWIGGGRKKMFRTNKAGELKIDQIVAELKRVYDQEVAKTKSDRYVRSKEQDNKLTQEAIAQKYGIDKWSTKLDVNYRTGDLEFRVSGINAEQADKFVNLAIELGLIRKS